MHMFYMANGSLLQIEGAAPYTPRDTAGIDASLLTWVSKVAYHFLSQHLEFTNAFRDTIPQDWEHIFAGQPRGG